MGPMLLSLAKPRRSSPEWIRNTTKGRAACCRLLGLRRLSRSSSPVTGLPTKCVGIGRRGRVFIRIALLGLSIHVGLVAAAAIVILSVVVLIAVIVRVLTTNVIKHGSVVAISVVHLIHVGRAILRVLLTVSIGVRVAWIPLALVGHVPTLLSMLTGDSWCRGVVAATLCLLAHGLLGASGSILGLSISSRGAERTSSTLCLLPVAIRSVVVVSIASVVGRVVVLRCGCGLLLVGCLGGERFLGLTLCLRRLWLLAEWIVGFLTLPIPILIGVG